MIYNREDKYNIFISNLDYLTSIGWSERKIAESIGKYPQYFYSIKNKQRPVSDEILKDIVNLAVMHGKSNDLQKPKDEAVKLENFNVMLVPLVHKYARAGYLNGYGDDDYIENLPKIPVIIDDEVNGKYIAFELKGESMYNGNSESYLEGDILICRGVQRQHWRNKLHINKWDFLIIHKTDGILLKRIIKHDTVNGLI